MPRSKRKLAGHSKLYIKWVLPPGYRKFQKNQPVNFLHEIDAEIKTMLDALAQNEITADQITIDDVNRLLALGQLLSSVLTPEEIEALQKRSVNSSNDSLDRSQ